MTLRLIRLAVVVGAAPRLIGLTPSLGLAALLLGTTSSIPCRSAGSLAALRLDLGTPLTGPASLLVLPALQIPTPIRLALIGERLAPVQRALPGSIGLAPRLELATGPLLGGEAPEVRRTVRRVLHPNDGLRHLWADGVDRAR